MFLLEYYTGRTELYNQEHFAFE